ncbi:MAG: TaqI-like C-terminal specificity domain-containing protein [Gemmatimonadales bacterium]
MTTSFEHAFEQVGHLVKNYEAHRADYLSSTYTEAAARKDFLDKFIALLGWDVDHNVQINPFQQEVRVERNVVDGAARRRADYAFFVTPNFRDVRFFVEAKKPSSPVGTRDSYFQTIRYAWNSQCAIAVITNFEELHVLDCRYKPDINTALERATLKFHFTQYNDRTYFATIYHLLGREAVATGAIERYADQLPKRRGKAFQRGLFKGGYQSVDVLFLEELDRHREVLAKSLKNNNSWLTGNELTEITQRALDRLVFIRFLEDKLIEPEPLVATFGDRSSVWGDFIAASRKLDATYNGIVFKKHPVLDSPDLMMDDVAFGDICEELAHVNSPYDFNAIPIAILGSIYERFLGKVIVATSKRARVEPSREARRAGGVFYTPEYVVSYLVEQTVGKLIDGKSPGQITGMRFLDAACGSGSFLLGVFDLLLRHHTEWYNANKDKIKEGDCVDNEDGSLRLTLARKREILLKNVFGIDVDSQAVEVAQLSLYLKLLEDESTASARSWQLEFHTTLLPSLAKNIVCGNSLIGRDVCDGDFMADDLERELNPMDWNTHFGAVLHDGGFDAIVGNPPYVRPHRLAPVEKEYFWAHFPSFTHKADLYACFVDRATEHLRAGGMLGYIISHGWMRLNSFQRMRQELLHNYRIRELVELPYRVFADAAVETGLLIAQRDLKVGTKHRVTVRVGCVTLSGFEVRDVRTIPQQAFHNTFQNVFDISLTPDSEAVKDQMRKGPRIGDLYAVQFGLKTGDDTKFLHRQAGAHVEDRPLLRGENVKRYACLYDGEYVWYVPEAMRRHRNTARPGEPTRFEQPKVLVKDTSKEFACAFDSDSYYVKDVLIVSHASGRAAPDLRALAAVINSKALRFYYRTTFPTLHVQSEELGSLPLPVGMAPGNGGEAHVNVLAGLVDAMQVAVGKQAGARTHADADFYQAKCAELDARMEEIVMTLYGLSATHRAIVAASNV